LLPLALVAAVPVLPGKTLRQTVMQETVVLVFNHPSRVRQNSMLVAGEALAALWAALAVQALEETEPTHLPLVVQTVRRTRVRVVVVVAGQTRETQTLLAVTVLRACLSFG
jgi:hypothetical protein